MFDFNSFIFILCLGLFAVSFTTVKLLNLPMSELQNRLLPVLLAVTVGFVVLGLVYTTAVPIEGDFIVKEEYNNVHQVFLLNGGIMISYGITATEGSSIFIPWEDVKICVNSEINEMKFSKGEQKTNAFFLGNTFTNWRTKDMYKLEFENQTQMNDVFRTIKPELVGVTV